MFDQFKKILGFGKKEDKSSFGKVEKAVNFLSEKIKEAVSESKVIMDKLHDLHKTNYELGLIHLKKGNLKEAIFRFKIVRKFWPQDYNSHLKLIYCYFITKQEEYANRAIEYLLYLDPNFKSEIEQLRVDATFYQNPKDNKVKSEKT